MSLETVMLSLNCLPFILAVGLMGMIAVNSLRRQKVPVKAVSIKQARLRKGKRK